MAESFGPEDHFNRKLVRDVKVKVFSYLSTKEKLMVLPQVCRNWADIAQNDSRVWTTMEVTNDVPIDMYVAQLNKSPSLRKLKVSQIHERCDDILAAVASHCPHLEELIVDYCFAEQKNLEALVVSCTSLTSCELLSLDIDSEMEPLDLITALSHSPHLKNLTLKEVFSEDSYVPGNPGNFPSLKELTMDCLMEEWQIDLLTIIGPQLEKLQVDQMDEEAWRLLDKHQQLQVLHVYDAMHMTDKNLLHGVGSLTNLRDLTLQGAPRLTPEGVCRFLARKEVVGRLENLDLLYSTASEECLQAIADSCPALRTLHITYDPWFCGHFFRDFISKWVTQVPLRLLHVWHADDDFPEDYMNMFKQVGGPQVVFHDVNVEDIV